MLPETRENETESKADFWQRHIEVCNRSSLTQTQYCRQHSLALATFGYWKRRLNMTRQKKARFYPLTVQPVQAENPGLSTAVVSLYLCNDRFRIDLSEGFSAPTLKKLVSTLEQL
ncbi:hypothetical protein [Desulfopila sp. IMCC35008]|uniref:IS66 family insertion sequence element accessory protein TnpA n=1 Tax=Desulfopila sp. IMCC35008 TaxID=2653858 RepID=UPI0013D0A86E|nr:hypothetical protein [Desulfopila sp. IMCC35008]